MTEVAQTRSVSRRRLIKGTIFAAAAAALGDTLFGGPVSTFVTGSTRTAHAAPEEKWINTACYVGKQGCVMRAHVVDGTVTEFVGHPDDPRTNGRLCLKGQAQLLTMYDPNRVKAPLKRTNAKGVAGVWQEISWDEALTTVGAKMKEVIAKDKDLLAFQTGGSKQGMAGRSSLTGATGSGSSLGTGSCFSAIGNGNGYSTGFNQGYNADLKYCDYLLVWGSSINDGGPCGVCWITWQTLMRDARERGIKVILIDPRREAGGNYVDEWIPIRPTTDLAMLLAMINVILQRGVLDRKFLTQYTNGSFLVKADGMFALKDTKQLVWDTKTNSAQPFDAAGVTPALEGSFTVDGAPVKTSFQLLKEHVAKSTPEWAAEICGVPADTIRRIANEVVNYAKVGSTTVVDGLELPYRPVGMMSYHGLAQQELGFQVGRAGSILFMLLGALHAVGGVRIGFDMSVNASFNNLDTIKIVDPPANYRLTASKYYPINSGGGAIGHHVMLDPAKYGVTKLPQVLVSLYGNPMLSNPPQHEILGAYKKLTFMAAIEPHLTEGADFFADIVLPAATIDKYDGLITVRNQYALGNALRLPPVPSLYQSKADMDIYIELADKAGILYGKGGMIERLNTEFALKEPNLLDVNVKPNAKDVFDRWAKSNIDPAGIKYFEEKGLKVAAVPASTQYPAAWKTPYGGIRYRIYGESLLRYQNEQKKLGVGPIYFQDYTALPTWRAATMMQSPAEYDLTLIDFKALALFHSQATFNPILHELEPEQTLRMNTKTAEAKGLKNGDYVWVESHNAVTGQTQKEKVKLAVIEGMRPDTVGMSHGYGHWVHPISKNSGPAPSSLYWGGEGYVATPETTNVFRTRVKVTKAEGGA